jgi:glutathione S-transferase
MADYLEVAEARGRSGMRLVLSAGFPGPWGEAAKGIYRLKSIPFAMVRQVVGAPNDELFAWTGHRNAPIAVYDDERPRVHWADILAQAERIAPEPRLVPEDPELRVRMFGLANELCGEEGLGWQRRLRLLDDMRAGVEAPGAPEAQRAIFRSLAARYGWSPAAAARSTACTLEIVTTLAAQLRAQRAAGRRYLVGDRLSALDLYWATFAVLLDPLPDEHCRMDPGLRESYRERHPRVRAAAAELLEHRDFVYREHLGLPLDF